MSKLNVGDKAPAFTLPKNGGEETSLSQFADKYLILYFYPKDDTPGCTTEARDFTALKDEFHQAGARILGVSKDTVAMHEKFIAKHDLSIDLGSDEDGKMLEDYGVWVEKNMYGRKYMGIQRATFLINPAGDVAHIWPKVKVKEHARAVLDTLKNLKSDA